MTEHEHDRSHVLAFTTALHDLGGGATARITGSQFSTLYHTIGLGLTHEEAAAQRGITAGTIEKQVALACEALGYAGRNAALKHDLLIAYGRALERLGIA